MVFKLYRLEQCHSPFCRLTGGDDEHVRCRQLLRISGVLLHWTKSPCLFLTESAKDIFNNKILKMGCSLLRRRMNRLQQYFLQPLADSS